MRKIKAWIRLMLGFSQSEANAFLILLPLMLIVIISEPVYRTLFVYNKPDDFQTRLKLDSLVAAWDWPERERKREKNLFVFDPNTASEKELDSLGIPARTIINFRNKGGKFRIKSDLKKIHGIDSGLYSQLAPYINLAARYESRPRQRFIKAQPIKFDLNQADTTQLKTVYGIGSVKARRIVEYRSGLGGFIAFDQLYEIWGLDSTVVSRLTDKSVIAADFTPNRLAINQASELVMARHPYIRTKLARAIVNYRFQHGKFAAVDDLKKIVFVDEKAFLRIKPYITLE